MSSELADRIAAETTRGGGVIPPDPTRGIDAEALRAHFGTTPAEELMRILVDAGATRADRLKAATALLPYFHKPQTVTSKIQGDPAAPLLDLAGAAVSRLTDDELATLTALAEKMQQGG